MEPWLFGYPVNLSAEFFQRQQESTYVHRILTFDASIVASDEFTLDAHVSFEATIPSTEPAVPLVDESRALLGGAGVGYDTRDNLVSPTSGAMFRADYEFGSKTIRPAAGGELREPVQKVSYVTKVGDQVCAVGYYK